VPADELAVELASNGGGAVAFASWDVLLREQVSNNREDVNATVER
jgi:hypothetical protein